MNSKNNRLNHDFQIAYFLAGSCHTPDAAYSLLKDLQEEREMALAQIEGGELRAKIKTIKAEKMLLSDDPLEILEAEADLADAKNNEHFYKRNVEAAKRELNFINKCIEKLQPHRKYSHLEDHEAHEAIQIEEWKLELIQRAENSLITQGNIAADLFQLMQQHPLFITEIMPEIENVRNLIGASNGDFIKILENRNDQKINIPKLLELK
jgi:hypothetical protein